MRIVRTFVNSLFTRTRIPGLKYTINQYVGCQFGCRYCYAKFSTKFWKNRYNIKEKWGDWIIIKENSPELVKKYVSGWVWMSSVSDPYQPIEKKENLTRKVLENMNKMIKLSILTKSDLILRDLEIFRRFNNIEIGLTINDFEGSIKRFLEPRTISSEKRIEVLKALKDEGFKTYAFISPVIPGILDVDGILSEIRGICDNVYIEFLNIRKAGKDVIEWLEDNFPESLSILKDREKILDYAKRFYRFNVIVH